MVSREEQIIKGCKKKNSRSQSLLYQQYAPALFGVALRYTTCSDDAQEVLQDAFLKIFSNIKQYKGESSIRAWMTKIVINEALSLYRLRVGQPRLDNYDDYEEMISDVSVTQPDALTHEILLKFIQNLPEGYRMVFNLCEIEEYPHEKVAKMLNCSESTCRSQLFKAKKLLRERINEFNKNEKIL